MSTLDSSKVVLSSIDGIYFPINLDDLEFIGPQVPMYNLETKIIGNNNIEIDVENREHWTSSKRIINYN